MCGILGVISSGGGDIKELSYDSLKAINSKLSHRGPDYFNSLSNSFGIQDKFILNESGTNNGRIYFSHHRLSILDLSSSGSQPMACSNGLYYIIFNGEIYNYLEIREQLQSLGYRFKSSTDTEVLLNSYIEWGTLALTKLLGMFAFAILDTKANRVILARDQFGIKPLYYTIFNQNFAFASEIPALLEIPGVSHKTNPEAIYNYLHSNQTDFGHSTFFGDIFQLPPAHYLEISIDDPCSIKPQQYWQITLESCIDISFEEASAKIRESFLESIQLHLRSEVPVGAALSGGIDSSSIVMAMRHVQGRALDLHTFSYIADQANLSEENWIDKINTASRAVGHKIQISPEDLIRDLDKLIATQGEPFGSTSIYAQYRVFQLAKEAGIKVMLDGQGADELLGGYRPYLAARLTSLIVQGKYKQAYRFMRQASQLSGVSTGYLLTRMGGLLLPEQLQLFARYLVGRQTAPPWLNHYWVKDHGLSPMPLRLNQQRDVLQEQLHKALTRVSLPMLLRYEDRNSMAHSIESRVPFLTPALAEFIFALPEEYLISADGTSKFIFRHAMRGIVPDAVLDRRDKIGFATPERVWIKQMRPWFEAVLNSDTARSIPMLNAEQMQKTFSGMVTGRIPFDFCAWRWVNLIRWAEYFNVDFET